MLKTPELEKEEKIWVTLPDGQVFEMTLEDAARQDEPEGVLTVTVSATLLQRLFSKWWQ